MKETIFLSFGRHVVLFLSGGDHVEARCWLVDNLKGLKNPPVTHLRCALAGEAIL